MLHKQKVSGAYMQRTAVQNLCRGIRIPACARLTPIKCAKNTPAATESLPKEEQPGIAEPLKVEPPKPVLEVSIEQKQANETGEQATPAQAQAQQQQQQPIQDVPHDNFFIKFWNTLSFETQRLFTIVTVVVLVVVLPFLQPVTFTNKRVITPENAPPVYSLEKLATPSSAAPAPVTPPPAPVKPIEAAEVSAEKSTLEYGSLSDRFKAYWDYFNSESDPTRANDAPLGVKNMYVSSLVMLVFAYAMGYVVTGILKAVMWLITGVAAGPKKDDDNKDKPQPASS